MAAPPGGEEDFDLFVSYAHADDHDGWVTALVEVIRQQHAPILLRPLRVFFDCESIQTMDDWRRRILVGLKAAKVMVAIVSPTYFNSHWCRLEWQVYLEHEQSLLTPTDGLAPIYIHPPPVLTKEQITDDLAAWVADLERRQYCDLSHLRKNGVAALAGPDARKTIEKLIQRIAERVESVDRALASPTNVPPQNPKFAGRKEELGQLRRMLARGHIGAIVAVQGVGGVGKTELALHYAHASADDYPGGRFLIHAAGVKDLGPRITELAPWIGVTLTDEDQRNPPMALGKVRAALQRRPPSLLLVDNVDDPALLGPAGADQWLPSGPNVDVLVTTRLDPAELHLDAKHCLDLDVLSEPDALELLERHRPFGDAAEREAAARIVARLGGHALALEVVAVFLAQNPEIPYPKYLQRLEAQGLGALDEAGGDPLVQLRRNPVKLLGPLLEPTLAALSPSETRALEYASLLPPDRIAIPWLRELTGKEFAHLAADPAPGSPDPWSRLVRHLGGLRLLIRGDDVRLARMHRIVQDVLRARIAPEEADQRLGEVSLHAKQRAAFVGEGWLQRENRWEIAPLLDYAVLRIEAEDADGEFIANWIFHAMRALGSLTRARELMSRLIAIWENAFEPDHPRLAVCYSNLALIEKDLGNLAEARQ